MSRNSATLLGLISSAAKAGDAPALRHHLGELSDALEGGLALDQEHAHDLVAALTQPAAFGSVQAGSKLSPYGLIADIKAAAEQKPVNKAQIQSAWKNLAPLLRDVHVPLNPAGAETLLGALRSSRSFGLLGTAAEQLYARGQGDALTRRMYGQALIETGHLMAAIDVLTATLHLPDQPVKERTEIQGLLGRAHKQVYVNYVSSPADAISLRDRFGPYLTQSIVHYGAIYDPHQPGECYWPGVNLIALVRLARMDGVKVPQGYDDGEIARNMIAALESKVGNGTDPWILSSLGEAYLAVGQLDKAAAYLGKFASNPKVDAFALQGTVRQLEEVWRLKAGSDGPGQILAGMKDALAAKDGSVVTLSSAERKLVAKLSAGKSGDLLESNVPGGEYINVGLLKMIVQRGAAIAAVRRPDGSTSGTGFLLSGADLDLKGALSSELFLLTNAHVIWDESKGGQGDPDAMAPSQAQITFDGDSPDGTPRTYKCAEVVWQSPSGSHDGALVRFSEQPKGIEPLKLAAEKPELVPETKDRPGTKLAVLGHPKGGPLALSLLGDLTNIRGTLVDMGPRMSDPLEPVYLRYITPTEGGNSGSPVLETTGWTVVGLHHAGFDDVTGKAKLKGQPGYDKANEGIYIKSIRKSITETVNQTAKRSKSPFKLF